MEELNELRRREAEELMAELFHTAKDFNATEWVTQLYTVMSRPPAVVQHTAHLLQRWNAYGENPVGSARKRFEILAKDTSMIDIVEVVITEALRFQKMSDKVKNEANKVHKPWETPALTFEEMIAKLEDLRIYLNTRTGEPSANGYATELKQIISVLEFIDYWYKLVPKTE